MTNDSNIPEVQILLSDGGDTVISNDNELSIGSVQTTNELFDSKENNDDITTSRLKIKTTTGFIGLTKEELESFKNDPFWKKIRIILFALFCFVWFGMFIAAVLIVVFTPKCPKRPKQNFWEKKTGYWVDSFAFVDSDSDNIGDFDGLKSKLDYIQKQLGAGYLILDPVFSGQYSNEMNTLGSVNSFRSLDPAAGDITSLKRLIKEGNKRGFEIVMVADFNALAGSNGTFGNETFFEIDSTTVSWVSRDGSSAMKSYGSQTVYSSTSGRSNMTDLNLRSKHVIDEIKSCVEFWLKFGVRGFLLTNVAFYVENTTVVTTRDDYSNVSDWYKQQSLNGQIFSPDTIDVLKEIRKTMDDVAKTTDKSRVLIVEAGNVGYGLTSSSDSMFQYINGTDKVVDMIISREFLATRGWSIENTNYSKSSINNYLNMISSDKRNMVALTSATSTSIRTTILQKVVSPFLLPGNPIVYFGTEIGIECNIQEINSVKVPFYPKDIKFPLDTIAGEAPIKCNHMIMPWDNSGKMFSMINENSSTDYTKSAKNTVLSLTAIGMAETIFQLHQKLIKIREEPSLQWGQIKMIYNEETAGSSYEIFVREAEGFPKIIVAIIKDIIVGKVFSLSSVCAKVVPILIYPSNPYLPEKKEVNADNIHLKIHRTESVHVFKCSA